MWSLHGHGMFFFPYFEAKVAIKLFTYFGSNKLYKGNAFHFIIYFGMYIYHANDNAYIVCINVKFKLLDYQLCVQLCQLNIIISLGIFD